MTTRSPLARGCAQGGGVIVLSLSRYCDCGGLHGSWRWAPSAPPGVGNSGAAPVPLSMLSQRLRFSALGVVSPSEAPRPPGRVAQRRRGSALGVVSPGGLEPGGTSTSPGPAPTFCKKATRSGMAAVMARPRAGAEQGESWSSRQELRSAGAAEPGAAPESNPSSAALRSHPCAARARSESASVKPMACSCSTTARIAGSL
mmetsp:Transcript_12782/g.33784  ORF Transcript_12782/g.33784 Transcript_12782/m.33784 type:complete len:201 (+) Transcript_12782:176-778(+)